MTEEFTKQEPLVPEIVSSTALESIQKAEIDRQIATAHQYPRSMTLFKQRAMEMVTLDEETAQSCIYRRPVGKDRNGKPEYAEGKSIRMAEIVGACYGNLRVGSILIESTPRYVKARGFAHDLESNFAASSEVVEATVDRNGNPYSERMRTVVAKAALAKARRDATFQVVPGALCKTMEDAARQTAIGTTATIGKRRTILLDWINKLGVEQERVWAAIGVNGIDDIGLKELEILTGIKTAIKDGDTTADDAFPRKPIAMPKETPPTKTQEPEAGWKPSIQEQLVIACEEARISAGELLTVLRADKFITEFQGVEDVKDKDAKMLLKNIDTIRKKVRATAKK